jgi:hypothetical protein
MHHKKKIMIGVVFASIIPLTIIIQLFSFLFSDKQHALNIVNNTDYVFDSVVVSTSTLGGDPLTLYYSLTPGESSGKITVAQSGLSSMIRPGYVYVDIIQYSDADSTYTPKVGHLVPLAAFHDAKVNRVLIDLAAKPYKGYPFFAEVEGGNYDLPFPCACKCKWFWIGCKG